MTVPALSPLLLPAGLNGCPFLQEEEEQWLYSLHMEARELKAGVFGGPSCPTGSTVCGSPVCALTLQPLRELSPST